MNFSNSLQNGKISKKLEKIYAGIIIKSTERLQRHPRWLARDFEFYIRNEVVIPSLESIHNSSTTPPPTSKV